MPLKPPIPGLLPCSLWLTPVFRRLAVPEQPTNLQGESVSPNAIQLTWDAPEDSGESIQSYELYYNDSHFRQNVRITISPPRITYLLEDLTPNTVYHIRVAAKSMRGEGASTPTIQVRTLEYGESQPTYLALFSTHIYTHHTDLSSPFILSRFIVSRFTIRW